MQLDLQSPEFIANPYPTYARLREQAPIYPLESGAWLITRYHDVEYLLKSPLLDKDVSSIYVQLYGRDMNDEPAYRIHNNFWASMSSLGRRKLVVKALNAGRVSEVRALVQKSADQLIDKWIELGQADLMNVFAYPLPVQVICNMLNIELEQSLDFFAETKLMSRAAEPHPLNAAELNEANTGALRLEMFFREICRQRGEQLGEDLVSQLLIAEEGGERLTEDEIISNLIVLFVAGYGTTANALCNTLRLLFLYPEQRELLIAKPELLSNAVDEALRFNSSAPITFRTAMESFEFNGVQIGAGDGIFLALDSANHDQEIFVEPDRFWIERPLTVKKPLTFGLGSHYCLGAKLGTVEVEVAVETLFRRLPNLIIDNIDQLKWQPTWIFRGLESLPVRW
ncbi:cytochrome P450 [Candidatus Methylobacter oryzae]|uniref:Cytochrome P450 n=1 Tax=Candidatus Methylobacter oryzae TaxID=2497749 RepID=A0ABY3C7U4_9GAMM|nr:cytochrome P450 [Candidatus Methylobacter oryzae]TRW92094.1 cytochrome P450 [Candidatus Methylobacter oryzae]